MPRTGFLKARHLFAFTEKKNNFGIIHGKGLHVAAKIAMNMFACRDFANMVRLACDVYDDEVGSEKAEAAKMVSKYLDRMRFKKEIKR